MDKEIIEYVLIGIMFVFIVGLAIVESMRNEKEEKEPEKTEEELEREFLNSVPDDSNYYNEIKEKNYPIIRKLDKYKPNKEIKVLVGDYMPSSITNTINVLESMGIKVDVAKSGVGIIRKIKQGNKYDLIISNNVYDKGNCDGYKTMTMLKAIKGFNTPVVVLTVSIGQRNEFMSKGWDDYMEKLLTQQQVLNVFTKRIDGLKFEKIN